MSSKLAGLMRLAFLGGVVCTFGVACSLINAAPDPGTGDPAATPTHKKGGSSSTGDPGIDDSPEGTSDPDPTGQEDSDPDPSGTTPVPTGTVPDATAPPATSSTGTDAGPPPPPPDSGADAGVYAYQGCYNAIDGAKICGKAFNDFGGYPGDPDDLVTCDQKMVSSVTHCAAGCAEVAGPDHCN